MFELFLKLVINTILSILLGAITTAIANGHYHQNWSFWTVTLIWFILIAFGFVVFEVGDGDINL